MYLMYWNSRRLEHSLSKKSVNRKKSIIEQIEFFSKFKWLLQKTPFNDFYKKMFNTENIMLKL